MGVKREKVNQEALRQLLEQIRLPEDGVTSRFKKALDLAYWKELNPYLSVSCDVGRDVIETTAIDSRRQNELVDQFMKEGYFQTEPIISNSIVTRMRECVERLKEEDWPLVFSFIYDQFWLVTRLPSLVQLLSAVLGPDYRQVPHIWTHYVRQQKGATGWPPHIDDPQRSNTLTVWIPLSDATLDNGCMYLIPQHLIPERIVHNFGKSEAEAVSLADLRALLQGSRALPARAGAVLCWGSKVIHWGSTCTQAGGLRISISQEFIGENPEPANDGLPLINVHSTLPTFGQRLHAVCKAILEYQRFEPLLIRYAELARRLVEQAVV